MYEGQRKGLEAAPQTTPFGKAWTMEEDEVDLEVKVKLSDFILLRQIVSGIS